MRLAWSEQAFIRLADIEAFIAADDPHAAAVWTSRILARAAVLEEFPEMGRLVPEIPGAALRELLLGNYRLVYRIVGEVIEVLTVFEAHRLFPERDLPTDE